MAEITLNAAGRMSRLDTTGIDAALSRKRVIWGSIVQKEKWAEIAGCETHLTEYFNDNNLWGYLSADPDYYSLEEVLAFMNEAVYDEPNEVISCTLKNQTVHFSKKEFARVFGLDFGVQFPLPEQRLRRRI